MEPRPHASTSRAKARPVTFFGYSVAGFFMRGQRVWATVRSRGHGRPNNATTTSQRLANQPLWMQDHRDQEAWGSRPGLSVLFRRKTSSTSIA